MDSYTLVPTWVYERMHLLIAEEIVLLHSICRQRQGRQGRQGDTLSAISGLRPAIIQSLLTDLERRGLVVNVGGVYDVPAEAPL